MHTHSKSDDLIKGLSGLPAFDCRLVVCQPETRAGRYLCNKFPLPPGHADLVADLAGLGSAVDR